MMVELQRLRETRRKEGEGRLRQVSVRVGARICKFTETHPLRLQRARGQHFVDEGAVRAKPVLEDPATCLVDIVLDRLGVLASLTLAAMHVAHSSHKAHVRLLDVAARAGALGEITNAREQDSEAMVSFIGVWNDCDSLLGVVG